MILKKVRTFICLLQVIKNPADTDRIGKLTQLLYHPSRFEPIFACINQDEKGRAALSEMKLMKEFDMQTLEKCAPGTFGRAYYDFMSRNGLSLELIPVAPDNPMNYVRYRIRKYHDMWHVLLDYNTSLPHEAALQVFTYSQINVGMSVLITALILLHAIFVNPTIIKPVLDGIVDGRVRGLATPKIWGVALEEHFDRPLAEVRAQFSVS